ncbi:hypothetical protein FQZ97_678760 [compost metagenome]
MGIIDANGSLQVKDSGTIWWQWDDKSCRVVRRVIMEPTSQPEDPYSDVHNRWYVLRHEMALPDTTCDMNAALSKLIGHLMYISDGDKEGVAYFLNWLAWLWQHPEAKIPVAIMLYSKHGGVGKSILAKLLSRLFGRSLVKSVDGSVLHKNFMDAVEHRRIMVLNELAKADRQDSYERFKSLVSEPTMEFEGKGRASRTVANFVHWIITTNNADCLPLMQGDRRVLVLRCEAPPKDASYYDELAAWIDGNGPEQLAGCFAKWTFPSEFNPHGHAPQTAATRLTQKESRDPLTGLVEELIATRKPPFDLDLGRLTSLIEQLNTLYPGNLKGHRVSHKTLPAAIRAAGGELLKSGTSSGDRAWCWRNQAAWDAAGATAWKLHIGERQTLKSVDNVADDSGPTSSTSGEVASHE